MSLKHIGPVLAVIATIGLFSLLGYMLYLDSFVQSTRDIVRSTAHNRALEKLPEQCTLQQVDAWGRPLKYERAGTSMQIVHVVTSAGRDGEFGTEDDIVGHDVDTNLSRLAGKMIADQAKEFGKGLKEGSGHENQFEKYDEPPKPSAWKRLKEKVLGSNKSE